MSQITDALPDVFAALGRVTIKRMFGGHGIWHDGLMCALVAQGTLYLKADAVTLPQFEALGLPPFRYQRQGQVTALSYRQAPESVFEDPREAARWTRLAFEAALRKANAKPIPKTPKRKSAARKSVAGRGVAPPAPAATTKKINKPGR